MPIPDFQTLMLPTLTLLNEQGGLLVPQIREHLARQFSLTNEELKELVPSKQQTLFHNRVAWGLSYLKQASLIESPRRSFYQITERGRLLLTTKPERITIKLLMQYEDFAFSRSTSLKARSKVDVEVRAEQTPDELISEAYERLNTALAAELRIIVMKMDPYQFEQLVVDLLSAMGYGGFREEAATVTQKSSDEGIDAVINQDPLGLDVVYIQAKRWGNSVGRPEIQKFVGALAGKKANKGMFIVTSTFNQGALEYAQTIQHKVILIDGTRLAELMIQFNVGVSTARKIEIKKVDTDYFES